MAPKPQTLIETFESMDGASIREIMLQAQAYLNQLALSSLVSVLKISEGLKLNVTIPRPIEDPPELPLIVLKVAPPETPAWKDFGKFVGNAGHLFAKAGVPMEIHTVYPANKQPMQATVEVRMWHQKLQCLRDMEIGDALTAVDCLSLLEPPDATASTDK